MSKVLGIDYGRKKIGLAIAESPIAEPFKVIRFESEVEAIGKVKQVVQVEQIKQVVLGISEGEMAKETMVFGKRLEKEIGLPVFFQDETLTTQEAGELAIKAGIKRKKRRALEDAYSAALILQAYLDSI